MSAARPAGHRWPYRIGLLLSMLLLAGCDSQESEQGTKQGEPPTQPVIFDTAGASIAAIAVTPDGHHVISVGTNGLSVWNTWTGKQAWAMADGLKVRLNADGRWLAVWSGSPLTRFSLGIFDTASGKPVATLTGAPAESWQLDDMVFNDRGDRLLVTSFALQVAVFPIADAAGPSPITPLMLRETETLANYYPGTRVAGFDRDGQSVFLLQAERHRLERWRTAPAVEALPDITFDSPAPPVPTALSRDGQTGWRCTFSEVEIRPIDASASDRVERYTMPLKMPDGAYSYQSTSQCSVSPDQRWTVLAMSEGGKTLELGYAVAIWRRDGTLALQDLGDASGAPADDRDAQAAALAYSPDSSLLYVADDRLSLHLYALQDPIKAAVVPRYMLGFDKHESGTPLLAGANNGVAITYHGASKLIWAPVSKVETVDPKAPPAALPAGNVKLEPAVPPADGAPDPARYGSIAPQVVMAVHGVMGYQQLVDRFETFCQQTLPTSYERYAQAAEQWRRRNGKFVLRMNVVMSQSFSPDQQRAMADEVERETEKAFASFGEASSAQRIHWCDGSAKQIEDGVMDIGDKSNLAWPLLKR